MSRLSRATSLVVALLGLASLGGCAPAANPLRQSAASAWCCRALGEDSAGFWLGLWHGFSAPVMFLISLFSSTIGVYEVHNNGGWYNFGFLLGLSMILGGSAGSGSYYNRRGER